MIGWSVDVSCVSDVLVEKWCQSNLRGQVKSYEAVDSVIFFAWWFPNSFAALIC